MRKVLYEIRLFNDKVEVHNRVFISKQLMRGESKTAERQKERERESVRDRVLLEMRDGVRENICGRCVRLI
jgi:hypothetical protein